MPKLGPSAEYDIEGLQCVPMSAACTFGGSECTLQHHTSTVDGLQYTPENCQLASNTQLSEDVSDDSIVERFPNDSPTSSSKSKEASLEPMHGTDQNGSFIAESSRTNDAQTSNLSTGAGSNTSLTIYNGDDANVTTDLADSVGITSIIASTSRAGTPLCVHLDHPCTGVMSICGTRREMEDTVAVAHRFVYLRCKLVGGCLGACAEQQDVELPFHFFGVYDGHGGSQASGFCRDRLHVTLVEEIQALIGTQTENIDGLWKSKWEDVMTAVFLKSDAEIAGLSWRRNPDNHGGVTEPISEPLVPETVGSTAVVAVVGSCQIVIANCGDSRAVLSRGGKAIALSVDHKPDRPDEMKRIEDAGGRVICWNGYRVFGVLAMSRAIGDRYLKPYVTAEPEVTCLSRSEDDECLILASDGLWDVLSNDQVCKVARKCLSIQAHQRSTHTNKDGAENAAAMLTKLALAQGSNDNISVVVIDLKNRND